MSIGSLTYVIFVGHFFFSRTEFLFFEKCFGEMILNLNKWV